MESISSLFERDYGFCYEKKDDCFVCVYGMKSYEAANELCQKTVKSDNTYLVSNLRITPYWARNVAFAVDRIPKVVSS